MHSFSFDELHTLFGNKFMLCKVLAERGNELLSNEAFLMWLKRAKRDLFEYVVEEFKNGKIKLTEQANERA